MIQQFRGCVIFLSVTERILAKALISDQSKVSIDLIEIMASISNETNVIWELFINLEVNSNN